MHYLLGFLWLLAAMVAGLAFLDSRGMESPFLVDGVVFAFLGVLIHKAVTTELIQAWRYPLTLATMAVTLLVSLSYAEPDARGFLALLLSVGFVPLFVVTTLLERVCHESEEEPDEVAG